MEPVRRVPGSVSGSVQEELIRLSIVNKKTSKDSSSEVFLSRVPGERLELSWTEARGILSPLRLPISPPRRSDFEQVKIYEFSGCLSRMEKRVEGEKCLLLPSPDPSFALLTQDDDRFCHSGFLFRICFGFRTFGFRASCDGLLIANRSMFYFKPSLGRLVFS